MGWPVVPDVSRIAERNLPKNSPIRARSVAITARADQVDQPNDPGERTGASVTDEQNKLHRPRSTIRAARGLQRGSTGADVRSHYDLSDAFFRLWQDPTQTYSCAYFEREDMTLQEAQIAKIDLALSKLGLQPGMTLLDVGCGWGSTMIRAIEKYDVNVIGLTLSKNQKRRVEALFDTSDSRRSKQVMLTGWENFDLPVDRIVSIGAFEHFGVVKYDSFFTKAYELMPADGVMLLHTICTQARAQELGLPITMSLLRFYKFIAEEIFPGGQIPMVAQVESSAKLSGLAVTRAQSLQPHYARTLDIWAANLQSKKAEAIAITSHEVYERYMKYLTGCADLFRDGYTDVCQFTCEKA